MRRDAAGRAERCALGKLIPYLTNRSAGFKAPAKWRYAAGAQRLDLLAPKRDQFTLVFHAKPAATLLANTFGVSAANGDRM